MPSAGLWVLLAAGVLLATTGLPAWLLLATVALGFAVVGALAGVVPAELIAVMPARILGLLEHDLLQALALYVLLGSLVNRLPLAESAFKVASRVFGRGPAAAPLGGLALGTLFAPMNGAVGASVAMLARTVGPRLQARGVPTTPRTALLAAAGTIGVVVPPSLVLILLSDAMLRAHTEALNATGRADRIVNLQDIFRGALVPALLLVACMAVATWLTHRKGTSGEVPGITVADVAATGVTVVTIGTLLVGVALGLLYAVEAAAAGATALLVYGVATRALRFDVLRHVLADAMALAGAIFALLVGATMFTLTVRAFGTDRWLNDWFVHLPFGNGIALALGLALLAACAFVLDAFEMIFVVVPLVAPPLLVRFPDTTWIAVLILLVLQASFLFPPFGYAVLMARRWSRADATPRALARALAPYLVAQGVVLLTVLAFPQLVWHGPEAPAGANPPISDDAMRDMLRDQVPPAEPVEPDRKP